MDFLLKGNELKFFVDEIVPLEKELKIFSLRIIPDIKSGNFPPFHTRSINVTSDLLEKDYYSAIATKVIGHEWNYYRDFKGSVIQGGYYSIPSCKTNSELWAKLFKSKTLVTGEEIQGYTEEYTLIKDIFEDSLKLSPYKKDEYLKADIFDIEKGRTLLNEEVGAQRVDALYVYGLYVGEGDSLLVIYPNGSVYLIDTNYYNGSHHNVGEYVQRIQYILNYHRLPRNQLKAVIISHKHLDHIRGASEIIRKFAIKFLLMNFDYEHETNAVVNFLKKAKKIETWINLNQPASYSEGDCTVSFVNPDSTTNTEKVAPDINDSSLVICIEYAEDKVYLTGDTGFPILNRKLPGTASSNNLLKVSHHGSTTGTDQLLLNKIHPSYAYISAGYNKRYKHPDPQVVSMLNKKIGIHKITISKAEKTPYTKYMISGKCITMEHGTSLPPLVLPEGFAAYGQ